MTWKLLASLFLFSSLCAEEGMWTFNHLPLEAIKKEYGVTLDEPWIEHVQKSGLRMSLGGSGSFVSAQGLVMTNHHVGAKAIYNLSTKENDLIEKGFLAKTLSEELKCPNVYVDQLVAIEDVTDTVNQAGTEAMSPAEREAARQVAINDIKKKAQEKTGLQPEVVTLYQGARYNLYLYKRYTDVRLVMAPERSIAYFGGDADNFEYPRYDLDICFFRVYQDDKPLAVDHYLKWSRGGPKLNEPLFLIGNPGQTSRMLTASHLTFFDTEELRLRLGWIKDQIQRLEAFSRESTENKRIASEDLFSLENSFKVVSNLHEGLKDSAIIENKEKYERSLYEKSGDDQPWKAIRTALADVKPYYQDYLVLEKFSLGYSKVFAWAKHLTRFAEEIQKPSKERLREYSDTELGKLELSLLSTEPVYKSLEKARLLGNLQKMIDVLGKDHPATQLVLDGKSLEERVDQSLSNTTLFNLDERKRLYEHPDEIATSQDPLILLTKAIDPYAREVRLKKENSFDSALNESYAKISKLIFDKYGESVYPDATFTPRLSYGSMRSYYETNSPVAPTTTIGGAYQYAKAHHLEDPYQLPASWIVKEKNVNKKIPLNFVSTNDSIGGNSGSPIINQKGEIVGLLFDGNSYSIIWSFAYDDKQGRSVSVHSEGITETLKNIYGAKHLAEELQGKRHL